MRLRKNNKIIMSRKIPEIIAPLCSNCLTPMILIKTDLLGHHKKWICPNKCGGKDRNYYETPQTPKTAQK
jgi:hypothetical protein